MGICNLFSSFYSSDQEIALNFKLISEGSAPAESCMTVCRRYIPVLPDVLHFSQLLTLLRAM